MGLLRGVWIVVMVGAFCASAGVAQRLPGGVRPEHYSLTITPGLKAAAFSGIETIDVVLDAPAGALTLNAAELRFVSVSAAGQDAVVTLDAAKEQATLTFARELPAGAVRLEIAYTGVLNDKLRGFYLSKTKLRRYGVTQFEATDARRAFPSFDEPALKATFDVTLVVDAGDTAFSNMKIVSDAPGPVAGKHTVAFATTPKMSTYLVAWLVGDFACKDAKSDGVKIRACATPDKVGLTKFALDTAKWTLHYYDQYFGIKYPLAKLDMVAVPDFEAGAMENFGCITYRETEMLVDGKHGSVGAKKQVANTVAHEMSHQWFGDMVTMAWWDNLWLNEGFATWMESKAGAARHPDWEYAQDVASDLDETMDLDARPTTRAIRTAVETPAEISALFDGIAYGKAGAVIGMVESWVGEAAFRKGVQAYVAAHLYGNATAEDFWSTEARVSGLPVDAVMRSYVERPGVPVVAFGDRQGVGAYPVSESRLVFGIGQASEAGAGWVIPVCLKNGACEIVRGGAGEFAAKASGPGFLFANAGDKGYFRTAYSAGELAAIAAKVEAALTPAERIGLLGDQWALMRGGRGSVGRFLDLALAVKQDTDVTVVGSAVGKIEAVGTLIATDEDRARLNAVVRKEFGPVYAGLGKLGRHAPWEKVELRGALFISLGEADDPGVMAEAESVTAAVLSGKKPEDTGVVDASVALAAAKGDAAMYEKMLRVAKNADNPDLKAEALHLLTRFERPELVIRTLQYAVSDEARSQDVSMLLALLLEQRGTQELAWQYVQQHWDAVSRKGTASLAAGIMQAAGSFCSATKRDEVAAFFGQHADASSKKTLAKAVERIEGCVALRAAQEPELRRWLDRYEGR